MSVCIPTPIPPLCRVGCICMRRFCTGRLRVPRHSHTHSLTGRTKIALIPALVSALLAASHAFLHARLVRKRRSLKPVSTGRRPCPLRRKIMAPISCKGLRLQFFLPFPLLQVYHANHFNSKGSFTVQPSHKPLVPFHVQMSKRSHGPDAATWRTVVTNAGLTTHSSAD